MSAPKKINFETAPKDRDIIAARFDHSGRIEASRVWWQKEFNAFITGCRQMTFSKEYGGGTELHSPDIFERPCFWCEMPPQTLSEFIKNGRAHQKEKANEST